jgi:tRNA pseudouridine55 synthase
MARKRRGNPVHGWVVIDKPSGITSSQVVNKVRWIFQAAKAGHSGTLDPLATGVLPIALGEATKTVPYVVNASKEYQFEVTWGEERSTDDLEGEVTARHDHRPGREEIEAMLPQFTGTIEQVPPQYSAIKVQGQRAYALARGGETVELSSREIRIDRIELAEMPDEDRAVFDVGSGKGAYMRSLARDFGRALGTCGHISALRRLRVGPFHESKAISLDSLEALAHSLPAFEHLLAVETALDDIPALALTEAEANKLRHGQSVPVFRMADRERFSTLREGDVLYAALEGVPVAISRIEAGSLCPVRVLNL